MQTSQNFLRKENAAQPALGQTKARVLRRSHIDGPVQLSLLRLSRTRRVSHIAPPFPQVSGTEIVQDCLHLPSFRRGCIVMAVEPSHLPPPTFRLREEELPPELILSIERILELHTTSDSDPFATLSNDFNSVAVLNQYFPDGEPTRVWHYRRVRDSMHFQRRRWVNSKSYRHD